MNVEEKVLEIIKELSASENITYESGLTDDLGLDSLNMVMLLIAIEDNFDINLDESDMDPYSLQTTEDIIQLVYKYVKEEDEQGSNLNNSEIKN